MKTGALALMLCVTAAQSVVAADCCCVLVCQRHSEDCSTCKRKAPPADARKKDCCKAKHAAPAPKPASEKRCAHLQPSSEVERPHTDALATPPAAAAEPLQPFTILPAASAEGPADDFVPIRGSPPLHLLFSVLRI